MKNIKKNKSYMQRNLVDKRSARQKIMYIYIYIYIYKEKLNN